MASPTQPDDGYRRDRRISVSPKRPPRPRDDGHDHDHERGSDRRQQFLHRHDRDAARRFSAGSHGQRSGCRRRQPDRRAARRRRQRIVGSQLERLVHVHVGRIVHRQPDLHLSGHRGSGLVGTRARHDQRQGTIGHADANPRANTNADTTPTPTPAPTLPLPTLPLPTLPLPTLPLPTLPLPTLPGATPTPTPAPGASGLPGASPTPLLRPPRRQQRRRPRVRIREVRPTPARRLPRAVSHRHPLDPAPVARHLAAGGTSSAAPGLVRSTASAGSISSASTPCSSGPSLPSCWVFRVSSCSSRCSDRPQRACSGFHSLAAGSAGSGSAAGADRPPPRCARRSTAGYRGAMSSGPPPPGLCDSCRHARRITSARGSVFLLCGLSKTDPRFPRYPRLPVLACSGYEQQPLRDLDAPDREP